MQTRYLRTADAFQWLSMRESMWPDLPRSQLEEELALIAADERQVAIGAFDGPALVAFAELSIHPHAVGCGTGPVAYLEAWYVTTAYRRKGVGRLLVEAGANWARARGCRELASDTWLDNIVSHEAHLALGFTESERLIHYHMSL